MTSAGAERELLELAASGRFDRDRAAGRRTGIAGQGTIFRVHGQIDGGWNYIASDRHPVAPGKLYRLSAWLRVDRRVRPRGAIPEVRIRR